MTQGLLARALLKFHICSKILVPESHFINLRACDLQFYKKESCAIQKRVKVKNGLWVMLHPQSQIGSKM